MVLNEKKRRIQYLNSYIDAKKFCDCKLPTKSRNDDGNVTPNKKLEEVSESEKSEASEVESDYSNLSKDDNDLSDILSDGSPPPNIIIPVKRNNKSYENISLKKDVPVSVMLTDEPSSSGCQKHTLPDTVTVPDQNISDEDSPVHNFNIQDLYDRF